MTLKKWGYLFRTSMLIGAVVSILTGFYILMTDPSMQDVARSWQDLIVYIAYNGGIGLLYSAFSQMGFFAYLTVNYLAKSVIRQSIYWATIQWIFVIIVFFDVIYLRYTRFEEANAGILGYSLLPIVLFVIAIVVGIWKSKETNASAFTPTVFFIFAVTILESVPALQKNLPSTTLLAVVPIVCCNIWQIMKLHGLLKPAVENTETA